MKMMLIVASDSRAPEVLHLLDHCAVTGYSVIDGVHGSGKTGRHMGTRAFPGAASLIFTIATEDQAARLVECLGTLSARLDPDEGLSAFQLEAEEVL